MASTTKKRTLELAAMLAIAFTIFIQTTVMAQKPPNMQASGIKAPSNIKVDGKATEWSDHFGAYNKATDVYYTLANDDESLYLVVHAVDPFVINKIIKGGITLRFNLLGQHKDKDALSITYPYFGKKSTPNVGLKGWAGKAKEAANTASEADSLMRAFNHQLAEKSKYVVVTGFKNLDTLLSVYNDDDIRVAELFDSKLNYTYELGLSLKQLGLAVNGRSEFSYHITLNGVNIAKVDAVNSQSTAVGNDGDEAKMIASKLDAEMAQLMGASSPTDFWGDYTLAK